MFPEADHDEQAQQNFIKSLRAHVTRNFSEGNQALYSGAILPKFKAAHGRPPQTRKELREAFAVEPYHQWWSSMMRTTQEILYDTVGPSIERQLPDLTQRAREMRNQLGSLTLNENVQMPRYLTAVDIHCKPGSYHTELMEDDVFAGAEFDRTYRLYSMGAFGRDLDDVGVTLAGWVKEHHPDLKPKRILDLGCTVGHSTGAYCKEFPDAEIHAIDVAAPCLRYGHARAVAMGNPIHFAQMNAEAMDYEDDYFDLIVSHAFLHETSYKAIRNIFKECQRVLKPGGLMAHSDGVYKEDAYGRYFAEWNAIYNNEPYLGTLQDEDFNAICDHAGFPDNACELSYAISTLKLGVGDERAVRKFGVVAART
jgi:SAM-dependent methyltransferase